MKVHRLLLSVDICEKNELIGKDTRMIGEDDYRLGMSRILRLTSVFQGVTDTRNDVSVLEP